MKKLFYLISLLIITSCTKKEEAKPSSNCPVNSAQLKDVSWHHLTGTLAELKFGSNGIYYEENNNDGNWTLSNGCDSIYVTRPSNNFYYRVLSLSNDTLKLRSSVFGDVTYFK